MAKLRKTQGRVNDSNVESLKRLISSQSKVTIGQWCINYTVKHILPIYLKIYPQDSRPQEVLAIAYERVKANVTPKQANTIIFAWCNDALTFENPIARAAARAIGLSASSSHSRSHAMGLVYYGIAAIAYDMVGLEQSSAVYDEIAVRECIKMEVALAMVIKENELNSVILKRD